MVAAGGFVGWSGDIHAYGGAHPNGTIGGCAGTIYRKDGAYGVVIVDNNGKSVKESYGADIPSQNSDSMDFFRSLNLVLSNGGAVTLTQNLKINDINLAASKAVLNLNQYVLTVMSGAHKNGKHWAPDASVTSKTVEGVTGEIIWPSGLLISIK